MARLEIFEKLERINAESNKYKSKIVAYRKKVYNLDKQRNALKKDAIVSLVLSGQYTAEQIEGLVKKFEDTLPKVDVDIDVTTETPINNQNLRNEQEENGNEK